MNLNSISIQLSAKPVGMNIPVDPLTTLWLYET